MSTTHYQIVFKAPRQVEIAPFQPRDIGADDVFIRTEKTLISVGTELTALTGDFPKDSFWSRYIRYPFIAGYSHVGFVERCGAKVAGIQVGDRVVSGGVHATSVVVPASQTSIIPDHVSSEEATFWMLGKTVLNGTRLGRIQLGESVVIIGAGLLGNLVSQYASLSGARPVIVVDVSQERLDLVAPLPGVETLLADENLEDNVSRLTGGRKANVVFEVTGNPQGMKTCLRLIKRRGRLVVLGSPRGPVEIDFHDEVHTLGLQIIGAHVSTHPEQETQYNEWTARRNGELFLSLLERGELQVDRLITHRYNWDQAIEAYDMLLTNRTSSLGVMFSWDGR